MTKISKKHYVDIIVVKWHVVDGLGFPLQYHLKILLSLGLS